MKTHDIRCGLAEGHPRKERQGIDHKQLEHKRKQARKGVTP